MAATATAKKSLVYANDGSGRDTFVNYAGAYWMNPLPSGTFFQSTAGGPNSASTVQQQQHHGSSTVEMGEGSAYPGRTLFGKSRYGTTVLAADQAGLTHSSNGGVAGGEGSARGGVGGGEEDFEGEATALGHTPYDVSRPEHRLQHPGHATVGLDGTKGGSTYNGVQKEWTAPRQVSNTLLRLAPTYESTCHYHLRTGRFFAEDAAPPHTSTLPDKGATWVKSRYY